MENEIKTLCKHFTLRKRGHNRKVIADKKQHRETKVKQRYNSNLMEKFNIYIYIYI